MDIEKIVAQMSMEEKIALCEGANFWETRAFEKYGRTEIKRSVYECVHQVFNHS